MIEEYERKGYRLLARTIGKMKLPSRQVRKTMSGAGLIGHIRSSVFAEFVMSIRHSSGNTIGTE